MGKYTEVDLTGTPQTGILRETASVRRDAEPGRIPEAVIATLHETLQAAYPLHRPSIAFPETNASLDRYAVAREHDKALSAESPAIVG